MAKRETPKLITKKSARIISIAMLVLSFIIAFVCVNGMLTPIRYNIRSGEASPATIIAPCEAIDEINTEIMREKARKDAGSVYTIDNAKVSEYKLAADNYFAGLIKLCDKAYALLPQDAAGPSSAAEWDELLTDSDKASLCASVSPRLDEASLSAVLVAGKEQLKTLEDITLSKLNTALEAGISEDGRDELAAACKREINAMSAIPSALKKIAAVVFDSCLMPTLSVDASATEAQHAAAIESVEPIIIKKGQIVVEKGNIVSESQFALLEAMDLIAGEEGNAAQGLGVFFTMLLIFTLFGAYMRLCNKNTLGSIKHMAIIAVLIILSCAIAYLMNRVDNRFTPILIPAMLCYLLVGEAPAYALTLLLSIVFGIMAGGSGSGILSTGCAIMSICNACGGFAAIFALKRAQSRGSMIAAGAVGGGYAAIAAAMLQLMLKTAFWDIAEAFAWIFGSCVLCALLVTGSLSIWETLFDVATSARLNELSNTNHPLLRQLMLEAPGTYQHSINVAALAEGAAERIGADPLLARVGAYYHDVGKLRRPLYFKENQKSGENIHDTLPPLESAQSIIAHQKDGVTILTKYKLPSAVIKICGEHHGNSLMTYFYFKAKQADESTKEKGFRYNGNRPSSKESAIVMMADGCEAAVRSLGDTNSAAVEQMVHKIIWGKLNENENMMSNAPLTIAEFTEIEKSFLKTFAGLMHDRIEYPNMEELKA